MERSFMVEVLASHPVDPADVAWVEQAADAWHAFDAELTGLELWEYLGWTREAYAEWFRRPDPPGLFADRG